MGSKLLSSVKSSEYMTVFGIIWLLMAIGYFVSRKFRRSLRLKARIPKMVSIESDKPVRDLKVSAFLDLYTGSRPNMSIFLKKLFMED